MICAARFQRGSCSGWPLNTWPKKLKFSCSKAAGRNARAAVQQMPAQIHLPVRQRPVLHQLVHRREKFRLADNFIGGAGHACGRQNRPSTTGPASWPRILRSRTCCSSCPGRAVPPGVRLDLGQFGFQATTVSACAAASAADSPEQHEHLGHVIVILCELIRKAVLQIIIPVWHREAALPQFHRVDGTVLLRPAQTPRQTARQCRADENPPAARTNPSWTECGQCFFRSAAMGLSAEFFDPVGIHDRGIKITHLTPGRMARQRGASARRPRRECRGSGTSCAPPTRRTRPSAICPPAPDCLSAIGHRHNDKNPPPD